MLRLLLFTCGLGMVRFRQEAGDKRHVGSFRKSRQVWGWVR
jgi:hypothetical protein